MASTLQAIRNGYEQIVRTALETVSPGFRILTENEFYSEDDVPSEYATITVTYTGMVETTLCEPMERVRGALVVELYVPKGDGPGRAQQLMQAVMAALNASNTAVGGTDRYWISSTNGPRFQPLEDKPHFKAWVVCGIRPSV